MRVGIDIDGVLFPWEDAVRAVADDVWDVKLGELTAWDTYELELGPERWGWLWTPEGSDAVLSQTWRTYPGVIEAVRSILKAGHSVHFVTHRDPAMASYNTARFLSRHFGDLRWKGLHVLSSSVPKRTLARWDVFIDDKPETVFDFLANTNATVFSPVRSWNQDELDGVQEPRLGYYHDPQDVVDWLEWYG